MRIPVLGESGGSRVTTRPHIVHFQSLILVTAHLRGPLTLHQHSVMIKGLALSSLILSFALWVMNKKAKIIQMNAQNLAQDPSR